MNSKRVFFAMIGLLVLLAAGSVAAVVVGDGLLQKQADKLTSLKADSQVLDQQQTSLVRAKKDISRYSDLESIVQTIVPQEKDQAETVRELVNIANANGIALSTISFPTSTLGQKSSTPGGASSTTPTSPSSTTAKPAVTQVSPVSNIPGLYVMSITIQQDSTKPVAYNQFINFLNGLEQNRRTAQVQNVTVKPDSKNRSLVTFSLVLNVYIKP